MIVVTGGAGFIGSCFVKTLNDRRRFDVLVVDTLKHSVKWKNLVGKKFIDFVNKHDFIEQLLSGDYGAEIEAIVHLGACSATTETDGDYLLENNYRYSMNLADYCYQRNIRFVYASSAATYGAGDQGYSDRVFEELKPLNMYGYSKHLFDQWILHQGLEHKVVGLKFFNVFGPNEYHKGEMASVVYKAYRQILETDKLRLFKSYHPDYADGEFKRDFVYIKDVCEVLWNCLQLGEVSGIYNVGTGIARSWNDLAHAVFRAMGRESHIEYVDMPEHIRSQYQYFTEADMTKMQETRAYVAPQTLEESVRDYVQGYLAKQYCHF
jgi:ADP-L-glycero-D-manno-heptose 6-epimerase